MPRTHGCGRAAYSPSAFPPLHLRPTGPGLFPIILLYFHHPWRSDVGRYDSMARIVLMYMARIVPTILLHFLRPWRSDALMPRAHGCGGAANNPFAFPPLHLDVQVPRSTGRARAAISAIAPCIALTSDFLVGRLAVRCRKVRLQGKDCSRQSSCISAIPSGQKEDDCKDAGGRATQGAVAEVELRQEQQSSPRSKHLGFNDDEKLTATALNK